jgi:hypothetical protein
MNTTQPQSPGSLHPVVGRRIPLTAKDWHDAADLFEQGAAQAEQTSTETHTDAACRYAVARMNSLAMYATGKALDAAAKAKLKSPNDPSSATRPPGAGQT